MRPAVLEDGHRLRARIFIRLVRVLSRQRIDAVAQMSLYRPEFFGDPMWTIGPEVLRGPSYWTPAEREYFAVFTSRLNECPFCVRIHTETTRVESGGAIDVNDSGSMRREVMAILPLLEKVTRTPDQVASADVDAVRVAGVPDEGIVDALHVNLIFNIMNRLANAFDFSWDSEEHVRVGAKVIHRISYRFPRILMASRA
jgi:AhpD family alkylhydroperoxidase